MISSLLYATKDLVSDLVNAFSVYLETVTYTVKDSLHKDKYDVESFDDVEEAPEKKKKGKKKSK